MVQDARLELWVGPAVPVKAGREVIEAVRAVNVINAAEGPDAFQIVFELSNQSPLNALFLISGGVGIPLVRVVIAVTIGGQRDVLIDGVMTRHQIDQGETPGTSLLTVYGEDLTRVMDYVDFSILQYPASPDFVRVTLILAKYAALGIVPNVLPSPLLDVPLPTERIPRHKGKDLGYVRELATAVGYVFYMDTTDDVGVTRAYWGPKIRAGSPQPALSLDFRGRRNVERLDFRYEPERASLPIALIQNRETRVPIPIPVPNPSSLLQPLAAIPAIPKNIEPITSSAKLNPVQAALIALAKASRDSQVASARGSLDIRRYGGLLKARRPVGVRGSGVAFNGLWYVEQTNTTLRQGSITQDFVLSRDGVVSTVERVVA